jgi:hypothetical protein
MAVSTSRILELYHAVRLAYKSNYDFVKYNGKLGKSFDGESSPYYSTLLKIQKRFDTEERVVRHLALAFVGGEPWITTIASDATLRATSEYEKRTNALDNFFRSDVQELSNRYAGIEGFKKLVQETEWNAPLFDMMMGGRISFDTFVLIDTTCNASKNWKSKVWKAQEKRIWLTETLLNVPRDTKLKVKQIIIEGLDIHQ